MLNEIDKLRARFSIGDTVQFKFRRKMLKGTLIRLNPKRAVTRVGEDEFNIPYELLVPMSENSDEREKRIEAVLQLARNLMNEYGLKKWKFQFDHSTRRAGCCDFRDKIISIAFDLARSGSDEDIRDTILHEIAHALVGKKHNHDVKWKMKAKEIGCSGKRTHRMQFSPPRWNVTCENRCWSHTAQKRNSRLICRMCGGRLVYSSYVSAT